MSAADEHVIRVSHRQGAAIISFNRPDRMNAMNRSLIVEFGRVGRGLLGDGSVRAILITGAGRAFCAGADLTERRRMNIDEIRAQLELYRSEFAWLDQSAVPVIAAINGACLGGGLEIALACHLRVAAPTAVLGLPETTLGIIPGAGGTQRLPATIGRARALEMILLGRRVDPETALGWGLVSRVSAVGTPVVDDTLEWIRPILEGAPLAQAAALRAIDAANVLPIEEGLMKERELYDGCLVSEDRVEALRAMSEKRKPKFEGR